MTSGIRPLRILVVDDDALIGTLRAEMLGDLGYVTCGIEATEPGAVEAALLYKPDLMIVDACLGRGSGVDAVEAISRRATIVHIFISGDVLRLGTSSVVHQKPFLQRDLVAAIGRATDVPGVGSA